MGRDNTKTRLAKLKEKQELLRNRIRREQSKINKLERRERVRQLIKIGELVEIAGLLDFDQGILLGGLIDLAENSNEKKAEWKKVGDQILSEKARRKAEMDAVENEG